MPNENIRNILGRREAKRNYDWKWIGPFNHRQKKTTVQPEEKKKTEMDRPIQPQLLRATSPKNTLANSEVEQSASSKPSMVVANFGQRSALTPHTTDADDTVFHWTYP